MLNDFFHWWHIFAYSYLTAWLVSVILGLVGVFVVARSQIFIGVAIAQSSALGLAVAMIISGWFSLHLHSGGVVVTMTTIAFAVMTAIFISTNRSLDHSSKEPMTAWIFLACSSLSLLILLNSPFGKEELHQLITSTGIFSATGTDVLTLVTLLVIAAGWIALNKRPLLLMLLDPESANAYGVRVKLQQLVIAIILGVALSLSMKATGLIYSFGALILPTLIAIKMCRTMHRVLWMSPIIGLSTSVVGCVVANSVDYPPALATVALQSLLYILPRRQ